MDYYVGLRYHYCRGVINGVMLVDTLAVEGP
jgi:hypothetical protein